MSFFHRSEMFHRCDHCGSFVDRGSLCQCPVCRTRIDPRALVGPEPVEMSNYYGARLYGHPVEDWRKLLTACERRWGPLTPAEAAEKIHVYMSTDANCSANEKFNPHG